MNSLQKFLDGKKTYIAAIGIAVAALFALADGGIDLGTFVTRCLEAFGLSALRLGVKKGR